jgi:hypothetical protein
MDVNEIVIVNIIAEDETSLGKPKLRSSGAVVNTFSIFDVKRILLAQN